MLLNLCRRTAKGEQNLDTQALEQIHKLVVQAGDIAIRAFRSGQPTTAQVRYKNGMSPVTQADLDVNDFLQQHLRALYPDFGWLSEETADDHARLAQESVFILDPIDGTRAFMAGNPCWTVSLALVERGAAELAVLHAPALNQTFLARRGQGARLNTVVLSPSGLSQPLSAQSLVRAAGPKPMLELCAAAFALEVHPKMPSLAYRLAHVAAGGIDLALAGPNAHDWDIVAADLILAEAGFCLSDLDGRKPIYNKQETQHGALVAARGPLHRAALAALQHSS